MRTITNMSRRTITAYMTAIRLFFCLRFLGDCLFRETCCPGRGCVRFCAIGLDVTVFCLVWRVDFCSNILKYSSYSLSFSSISNSFQRGFLSPKEQSIFAPLEKGLSYRKAFSIKQGKRWRMGFRHRPLFVFKNQTAA